MPVTRTPLDLVGVYLTPTGHAVGQRLSLDTIDRRLRRLPRRPVLRLLALTAFRADRSITDVSERVALAEALLPPGRPDSHRALALIRQGSHVLVSSQAALALAVRALVNCPEDSPDPVGDLPRKLGALLLGISDHLGPANPRDSDELMLELVRLGLFYG